MLGDCNVTFSSQQYVDEGTWGQDSSQTGWTGAGSRHRQAGSVFYHFYNLSRMRSLERPPNILIEYPMRQQNVYYSSVS